MEMTADEFYVTEYWRSIPFGVVGDTIKADAAEWLRASRTSP